jgi:hypothetical protein
LRNQEPRFGGALSLEQDMENGMVHLEMLLHSKLSNYIVPGLDSYMLGRARLFENTRVQPTTITPHSHRFDFACCVLRGAVVNTLWLPTDNPLRGDKFAKTTLQYKGTPGEYSRLSPDVGTYMPVSTTYEAGSWYSMRHDEIHAIVFSKDAIVLFLEGQEKTKDTCILEPYVNGKHVPTFSVQPWMFEKE